jgi:hypothetical protein
VVKNEDFYVAIPIYLVLVIFEIVLFAKPISMNLNWILNDFENILNCICELQHET